MRKKGVIPAEAGIQVFEILIASSSLDARRRRHDELRHSTS